ncbi:MAG: hypothetical protein ACMXYC_00560 [Candidatus Woesearchaeota archaeon]
MVKNHLKRLAVPRTWPTKRKGITFIARPQAGKLQEISLPLIVVVRDMLQKCSTSYELKAMLGNNVVVVDGKHRKSVRYPVGLFDIITFTKSNESYRLVFNSIGTLVMQPVSDVTVLGKVIGKGFVKGQLQLQLLNGRTVLYTGKDALAVGDTVTLKEGKVDKILSLQKGATVVLIGGKHRGKKATVVDIQGTIISVQVEGMEFTTKKAYAFVVGDVV